MKWVVREMRVNKSKFDKKAEAALTHLLSLVSLRLHLVPLGPDGRHTQLANFRLELVKLLELVVLVLEFLDQILFRLEGFQYAPGGSAHIGNVVRKIGVGPVHPLQLGGLGEEVVLVLRLATEKLLGLFLIQDGDGILHLDVELIEHGVEILLVAALLRAVLVEELVAVVAAAEGDGPLDGDGIAVHVVLVAVVSAVQDGDADLGAIAVRSGLLPDQLLEVGGTMSPAGACTEADLDGGQDGGLLCCRWRER